MGRLHLGLHSREMHTHHYHVSYYCYGNLIQSAKQF